MLCVPSNYQWVSLRTSIEQGNNIFGEAMMQQKKGGNLAAWSIVQNPKDKGGVKS